LNIWLSLAAVAVGLATVVAAAQVVFALLRV